MLFSVFSLMLLYHFGKVVKIPISMNENYFIDRWGHDMVVLLVSLEDPPAPPFYRQEQLSSREGKSLVSLISGRIEANTAIAWLSAIMLFFYLPLLVSSVSPYKPPSAKNVRIVINLHFSRKSFLGWHWEQKNLSGEKTQVCISVNGSQISPFTFFFFFHEAQLQEAHLTWDEAHIREGFSP